LELRALAERQPELASAVAMHLEIAEMYRRIQGRVPLPWFELSTEAVARHNAEARPLLRFEEIPIELTDLRLLVRQTADILRRHDAIEESDRQKIEAVGRDMKLLAVAAQWYRQPPNVTSRPASAELAAPHRMATSPTPGSSTRCSRSRCGRSCHAARRCCSSARRWRTGRIHTARSAARNPDFAVITPSAERHLICGRCSLQWKFDTLTCPYCRNSDRSRITSFATPNGQYRVYACDVCRRYLKAYDARHASRPVMPVVDGVATLPLDAAAIQRGYQ
jgi:hypothetical protein